MRCAGDLLHKFVHNVSMRAKDGFVTSAPKNMSVARICFCRWLILRESECVGIQENNMIRAERQITQHIRYGLRPRPSLRSGTLLPSVATLYMLDPLSPFPLYLKPVILDYGICEEFFAHLLDLFLSVDL